jgi:K+ transporter
MLNPYLAKQVWMSDAWEEWDFVKYNELKNQWFTNEDTAKQSAYQQCFLRIGGKYYGDVINLPLYILKNRTIKWVKETRAIQQKRIRKYISMFLWKISQLNTQTKIKIITINNKCIWII